MDINSYKEQSLTAGISIFHDGLPKLTSVHCYDRGNIATFGLQSCNPKPPKPPPQCYPIQPIPRVPLVNEQRTCVQRKQRPQVYSGAFYPPGSQPTVQFVDGRPIIMPSTFNNKFISKEHFDATVNKTKSVVYNEHLQYPACCKPLSNPPTYSDLTGKGPVNCMPGVHPYMVNNELNRRKMVAQDYNRRHPLSAANPVVEGELYPTWKALVPPLGYEHRNCPIPNKRLGNPHTTYIPRNPPIVIDLEMISDDEPRMEIDATSRSNNMNQLYNNRQNSPPILYEENVSYQTRYHGNNGMTQLNNATTFRCNACQQVLTLENSHTYINDSLKTSSGYNFTSTLLCNECARKNRMWDSVKNLSAEVEKTLEYHTSANNDNSRNNDRRRMNREHLINKRDISNKVVIDLENPTTAIEENGTHPINAPMNNGSHSHTGMSNNMQRRSTLPERGNTYEPTGTPNCTFCDKHTRSCSKCGRSCTSNINKNLSLNSCSMFDQGHNKPGLKNNTSPHHSNGHEDKAVNGGNRLQSIIAKEVITVKTETYDDSDDTRIILHMENIINGDNTIDSNNNINNGDNAIDYNNNINNGDNTFDASNNIKDEKSIDSSLELEIDENSFESFINNGRTDTCVTLNKASSPSLFNTHSLSNGDQQTDTDELSRERKSSDTTRQLPDTSDHVNEGDKSNPSSPSLYISKDQLQKFRNKVVPILKAKNWIRQNGLDDDEP